MIDSVMSTYLDLGFITKEQYADFNKDKQKFLTDDVDDSMICQKFFVYLGILPDESKAAEDMVDNVYELIMHLKK